MMYRFLSVGLAVLLSACVPTTELPGPEQTPRTTGPMPSPAVQRQFVQVVNRIEPIAEQLCRETTRGVNCDIQIVVDTRPDLPPNAFQTLDESGRPIVGFTLALIADARNADELAFVMGHETAHHIAGHIPRQEQSAMAGAMMGAVLASMSGADEAGIAQARDAGAVLAVRNYSKDFELEADALGTQIAWAAGYDPVRGAQFFNRLPDPGDRFLGSHPPNAQRIALVQKTVARLEAGQ
ncbi:peptidase M48 [Gemmobacter tilapiae]|uniref:Peptidase M48 n=2 Tax=Neogemmobacter tilapiae TaxID=875041 RepID=A0A918TNK0_9RHOB|nr:peptidase M48 [Gemmobacter tilapiae]